MTIDDAIEILELNIKEAGTKMPADTLDALKLGVKALKRHRDRHTFTYAGLLAPLRYETPDADSP